MEKDIELAFIEQTLERYGARLKSSLIRELNDKDLISKDGSPHLKDNIRYDIARTGMSGYHLRLYFPDYGRLVEIRYHLGGKKNSDMAFMPKGFASKVAQSRNSSKFGKKKKDTRWYSKTAYGSLNSLIGQLLYGLTDSVQETIKNELTQQS